MFRKKIGKKLVGNIIYELDFFERDSKYIIYKYEKSSIIIKRPKVAEFDNEKDAMKYWLKIDK